MGVIYFHSRVFGTAGSWLIGRGFSCHLQVRWGLCSRLGLPGSPWLEQLCSMCLSSFSFSCHQWATGHVLLRAMKETQENKPNIISSFRACIMRPNIPSTKPGAWLNPESWRAKLCGRGCGFSNGWTGAIDVIGQIPPWISSSSSSLLISSHCFLFDAAIALGTSVWLGSQSTLPLCMWVWELRAQPWCPVSDSKRERREQTREGSRIKRPKKQDRHIRVKRVEGTKGKRCEQAELGSCPFIFLEYWSIPSILKQSYLHWDSVFVFLFLGVMVAFSWWQRCLKGYVGW